MALSFLLCGSDHLPLGLLLSGKSLALGLLLCGSDPLPLGLLLRGKSLALGLLLCGGRLLPLGLPLLLFAVAVLVPVPFVAIFVVVVVVVAALPDVSAGVDGGRHHRCGRGGGGMGRRIARASSPSSSFFVLVDVGRPRTCGGLNHRGQRPGVGGRGGGDAPVRFQHLVSGRLDLGRQWGGEGGMLRERRPLRWLGLRGQEGAGAREGHSRPRPGPDRVPPAPTLRRALLGLRLHRVQVEHVLEVSQPPPLRRLLAQLGRGVGGQPAGRLGRLPGLLGQVVQHAPPHGALFVFWGGGSLGAPHGSAGGGLSPVDFDSEVYVVLGCAGAAGTAPQYPSGRSFQNRKQ